ncbi:MAG TPA: galactose-1-phosphate uridylyltransferase [Jatrophihabitans sp.]|jgi:UDPglucose--hexose-1-phosphate uridylyltransferase|uniref:galactose-1-phosphate uridylyltransferase n=1 Tax=Jatrophihabitans sp. TaxID=1932789 RepID=UPI002E044112|nr:galactose-1-phosphate uridylyltransferase [Jatrophihabitans sp.]
MSHRSEIRLADGRELYYYDQEAGRDRSAPDERVDLPPAETSSQIRWNPLLRDYSVVAGHRQSRTYKPPADLCPLDPSGDGRHTEIPASDYEVVVFENRFPSFSLQSSELVPTVDVPPFRSAPGAGRCEVVCFSSAHDLSFSDLPLPQVETVIDAWVDRTQALSAVDSIEYVYCFENRGEEIGVTLTHPHGQIYGYPFVPPRFYRTAEAFERHRERTGECLQCMLLAAEVDDGSRVVIESDHWVAYVPFAARWPYEVRVVPRRHVPDLPALDGPERKDLAGVYVGVLQAFDSLFDTPTPYIANWQQAPVRQSREVWHLAAELFTIRRAEGRLKYLAGSESGAAVWINDIAPETAAEQLRERLE